MRVEEALEGLAGVRRLTSVASESTGTVSIEVASGTDPRDLAADIEQRVERISGFPAEAEAPRVTVPSIEQQVISVVVSGALPERELREVAGRARDDLEALPNVSSVVLSGGAALRARDRGVPGRARASRADPRRGLPGDRGRLARSGRRRDRFGAAERSCCVPAAGPGMRRTSPRSWCWRAPTARGSPSGTSRRSATASPRRRSSSASTGFRSVEIEVYRRGVMSALTVAEEVKGWIEEAGPRHALRGRARLLARQPRG